MTELRSEEAWAAECIRSALGPLVEVVQNDDGSSQRMHDLNIMANGTVIGAIEVTKAADAETFAFWKLATGHGRWVEPNLDGGWTVRALPQARVRRLKAELPALLRDLEERGVKEVRPGPEGSGQSEEAAYDLGITDLYQTGTAYPGSIYPLPDPPPERSVGRVPETGDPLADWLGEWIGQPEQADNLEKLRESAAAERHLFVILPGFANAPFAVISLLMQDHAPLPTIPPVLPPELTHVWAVSTWDKGDGMRWAGESGWQSFLKANSGSV